MPDKKFISILAAPFIAAVFSAIIVSSVVKFKTELPPKEAEIMKFSYSRVQITRRQPIAVSSLYSPIEIPSPGQAAFPKTPLSQLAPQGQQKPQEKLSLIFINKGKKLAIINGIVVKEGDVTAIGRVEKIERGRVLINREQEKIWMKIE